jgi:hypothetical protein
MTVKEVGTYDTVEPDLTLESAFKKRDQIDSKKGLKVMVWGAAGVGKSYFGMTFPEPVYVIDTDGGAPQLLEQFPDKDIRIMDITEPYAEKDSKKKKDPLSETDPIVSLLKFDKATWLLKDVTHGTIVLDSVTDIWEWMGAWMDLNADKFTQSGQMMRTEWGKANAKYTWMMKRLTSRPCNLVLTAKHKSVYDDKGKETSQRIFAAQKFTDYIPDVVIHLEKITTPSINQVGKIIGTKTERVGTIIKNRFFDDLNTVKIQNPTYELLKEKYQARVPKWVFG